MKIAFFTFSILEHGGGLEKYFINTARELSMRYDDLKISIVTCDENMNEKMLNFLSIYYIKKIDKSKIYREKTKKIIAKLGPVKYIKCKSFSNLRQTLSEFDLIYTKNEILDLMALKLVNFKNLPNVITGIHTPIFYPYSSSLHSKLHNFLYLGPLYRWLLKDIKLIHVMNEDDKRLVKENFRIKVKKILYPFNVEVNHIKKNTSPKFNILFVGRLTEQKGIKILLECINSLSTTSIFKSLHIKIAGSGDVLYEKELKGLDKKFKNINYLGHVPNSEISEMYKWTDITVIPSRYETVNYVALETGSYGKIAIASNIPGPREVIKNKKTGFLIDPTKEELEKMIINLQSLKESDLIKFRSIGMNAQEYIKFKFHPDLIYTQLYLIIKQYAN